MIQLAKQLLGHYWGSLMLASALLLAVLNTA
jgi:hypothetical protein